VEAFDAAAEPVVARPLAASFAAGCRPSDVVVVRFVPGIIVLARCWGRS
jgi:hypothetical protein